MSLRDGSKKMSKSDLSDQSRITFTDTEDEISKKFGAQTDPECYLWILAGSKAAEAANLVGIFAALSGQTSVKC